MRYAFIGLMLISTVACGVHSPADPTPQAYNPPAQPSSMPAVNPPAQPPSIGLPAQPPSVPSLSLSITVHAGASPNTLVFTLVGIAPDDFTHIDWDFGDGKHEHTFHQVVEHSIDEPQRTFTVIATVYRSDVVLGIATVTFTY